MSLGQIEGWESGHSLGTRLGVIHTELHRLLLTNLCEETFLKHRSFFLSKLKSRGYPVDYFRLIAAKYSWSMKQEVLSRSTVRKKQVLAFKFPYSDTVPILRLGGILKQHDHFLPRRFFDESRIVVCHTVGRNLFRLRYGRFL